jgi:hypothetical protein
MIPERLIFSDEESEVLPEFSLTRYKDFESGVKR